MKKFTQIILFILSAALLISCIIIMVQWIYSWFVTDYDVNQAAGLFSLGMVVFALSEQLKHEG